MSTRSILGLVYVLQGLEAIGEDISAVLERYGLDPSRLDPGAEIDRALELRILTEVGESIGDPLAGLKVGTYFGLAGYGPFTMLLMTCENAYEAFRTGVRYQALTYLFGTLSFAPGDKVSALVLEPAPLPPRAFRFRVDGEVSGTFKLVRDMQAGLGVNLGAERIDMPYPEPPEAAAYEKHFGCPVRFGEPVARFWIRNEHLQLHFPTADPAAHRLYQSQCDRILLERRRPVEGLSEQVRGHLRLFTGDFPSAGDVAAAFDIPERSFRRQLRDEGTSFRELLDQVRFDKTRQLLLHTDRSVETIARELGYGEPASFIRAFQRWAGQSPAAYRREERRRTDQAG